MRIYVDMDDVLCETARAFVSIVERMFDKHVPYEQVKFFDLDKSFGLDDNQFEMMMIEGHLPEVLLSYKETLGASETINKWIDVGNEVNIITGRPYSAYEPSRRWLDEHNLKRVKLYCLNKYGRDAFIKNSDFSLEMDEFMQMRFDFAVEDSPKAFKHLAHLTNCKVAVFDRPWNKNVIFPSENYVRCFDWKEVDQQFRALMEPDIQPQEIPCKGLGII